VALQGREHTHEGSAGARSEQLGHDTPDFYPDKRDPDTRDWEGHEDREPGIQRPSETAPECTSGGDQDGGDVDDLAQSRGKSCCFWYTTVHIDHY